MVCCGAFTDQFYEKGRFEMRKAPQETFVINNNKDLPPTMILSGLPELEGWDLYALRDGENMEKYKFGYEKGSADSTNTLALLKKLFPTKYQDLENV